MLLLFKDYLLSAGHVHITDFNIATLTTDNQLATSMSGTTPYMGKCGKNENTFVGLNMTRDFLIYLYVRCVRINIRQYGQRFTYSSWHFKIFNAWTALGKYLKYFELLPFEITFKNLIL